MVRYIVALYLIILFSSCTKQKLQTDIILDKAAELLEMNPDMDKELAAFIDRLLAKNPDDRPADWKKVRAGLLSIKRRLFPAAVSGGGVKSTRVVRSTSTGTSWSAESKEEKEGIFKKFPWLMPAILIVIIGGALLYMAIEMGLFK